MYESLPLGTRLWFCLVCALRVLFDGAFAARAYSVRERMPELPEPPEPPEEPTSEPPPAAPSPSSGAALVLLGLMQREGRFVDFLEQEIAEFDDAEIGAAARVVHEGCRKTLHAHASIAPILDEEEESEVVVSEGFDTGAVKLIGNVTGKPPHRGVLRHRGWRIEDLRLPTPTSGHDAAFVAPAEVEL